VKLFNVWKKCRPRTVKTCVVDLNDSANFPSRGEARCFEIFITSRILFVVIGILFVVIGTAYLPLNAKRHSLIFSDFPLTSAKLLLIESLVGPSILGSLTFRPLVPLLEKSRTEDLHLRLAD
jgi:hypothetical protein